MDTCVKLQQLGILFEGGRKTDMSKLGGLETCYLAGKIRRIFILKFNLHKYLYKSFLTRKEGKTTYM